jgi:uncharacterized membrane protein YdjX (TVP38/TMEM64 family)
MSIFPRLLKTGVILTILTAFLVWGWMDHFSFKVNFSLTEVSELITFIKSSGYWGPLIVIMLMTLAITFSPLPSAPIAMASGALYGHTYGTLYVFIGSLLGASLAFFISRCLHLQQASDWLDQQFPNLKVKDQKRLMWSILLSRLVPFVSFDLVSYAAGLTVISYFRFICATSIGILPASFLLAHFGHTANEQSWLINISLLIVIGVTMLVFKFRNKIH